MPGQGNLQADRRRRVRKPWTGRPFAQACRLFYDLSDYAGVYLLTDR